MPPPPRERAPGPCFLFIPCGWDSMGRNSAPCPTAGTQTSILRRGSRDAPGCRGRGQGCYKGPIVSWGPGSEQGLGSGDRSQPEPCRAAGGREGQGRAQAHRRAVRGQGWLGGRWRGLPPSGWAACLAAHEERGILGGAGVQPRPKRIRSPACAGLGGGATSPSSPLKADSFSGRSSSSLYFWSQRNSYRGERAELSKGSAGRTCQDGDPLPRGLLSQQARGAGSSVCPDFLSTLGTDPRSPSCGQEVCSTAGWGGRWGVEGLL